MMASRDLIDVMAELKGRQESFAVATVVRTRDATSAKAGAKALITDDGRLFGWIGGGCTQGAVRRAARQALQDGRARLISVWPKEALDAEGIAPGSRAEGLEFHRSVCPSGGTVEIFIEPMLPRPLLLVCGASPVARALAELGPRLGYAVTVAAPAEDQEGFTAPDRRLEGFDLAGEPRAAQAFVVVATQGKRDREALAAALATEAAYVAFVGSRRKAATLKAALAEAGVPADRLARLRSPAGLDIGAIAPEEIALSILAEIVRERRAPVRQPSPPAETERGADGTRIETRIVT